MVDLLTWCTALAAPPLVAMPDFLTYIGRQTAGLFWVATRKKMRNLRLEREFHVGLLDPAVPRDAAPVADQLCCLLAQLGAE
jgi:hypothetical protein